MPETDTFDLDAAFARLEHDIADSSSPRGAGVAIATARTRRRRRTIAAVAAVALVAVGGVALAGGLGSHDTTVEPAGLPSPAPYDNAALTQATKGWAGPWGDLTSDPLSVDNQLLDPHCLAPLATAVSRSAPGSTRSGGGIAVTPGVQAIARSWLTGWSDDHPDAARAAYAALVPAFASCAQASPAHSYAWVDAQAESWDVTGSGPGTQHLWVAEADDALAVVSIISPGGPVPGDVDRRVAEALVAGLQSPASFTGGQVGGGTSASSSPSRSVPSGFVSGSDFAAALGSWSSGWSPQSARQAADGLPCSAPDSGPSFGQGTTLGGNGDQELYGYDSTAEAESAVQLMLDSLKACPDATYVVQHVALPFGGRSVTVVAATGQFDDDVWLAREGRRVFAVIVPNSDTLPPRQVSQAIGGLMFDALHGVSASESTPPPAS